MTSSQLSMIERKPLLIEGFIKVIDAIIAEDNEKLFNSLGYSLLALTRERINYWASIEDTRK